MMHTRRRIWGFTDGVVALTLIAVVVGVAPARGEERTRDDVLREATAAVEQGHFHQAEALIEPLIGDADAPVVDEAAILRENIRRIRRDFRLRADDLLAKIQASIPDASAEDVERWRASGDLQCRMIDDEVCYFAREPSNLLRFCDEAKRRRTRRVPPAHDKFDFPRHIERLLARADGSDSPEVFPVHHHVTYTLRVNDGNPRIKPGAKVRCWLPYPQEYRQQKNVRLIQTEPAGGQIAPNGSPQRTVYFEKTVTSADEPVAFSAEFEFTTSAFVPDLNPALAEKPDVHDSLFIENTAERPPHIVFTPEIRRIADEVAGGEPNPLLKAKKLYRWVCANVRYCSEMEYSTIANISDKAMSTRRGDCGVQALLFIALCRAAGVPARWQSGWETQPAGWNMHDWVEFYVAPWGWLPADPSYGMQEHYDSRVREFYCGHMDPYRMIVNLDYARELVPPKTSYRSEPNDFQRGEIEIDGHNLYFDEWSWTFDVETLPVERSLVSAGEALDAIVPDLLAAENIPGAVVAIGRRTPTGYQTWESSYGYMQIEPTRVPMPVDAIFDMASMTKPIATGTCLAILLERGLVSLDDPVSKFLPEFAEGEKAAVTIRHLATHTSGEIPYIGAGGQKEIREKAGFPCPDAMRAAVRDVSLDGKPGAQFRYSCLNAILSAEIVKKITGEPLDRFAAENIYQPLGMVTAGFNPSAELRARCVPTTRAEHGTGPGGFLQGQVHDPMAAMQAGVSGNAGLFASAQDLHIFAQMMLGGGTRGDVRILKPETVKLVTSVHTEGVVSSRGVPVHRGVLWDVYYPQDGGKGADGQYAFGHTGYTGTAIRIYPQAGYYVIALTNRVHPDDSAKVEVFRHAVWRTVGDVLLGDGVASGNDTPAGR